MSERVAVYIDFDNVVISHYDDVHGKQAWRRDDPRQHGGGNGQPDAIDEKLAQARVDIGAIIDFAASFGTVSLSRAYADWSVPVNASYRTELIERSLHLVQLFNASGVKNGADIRLAVDAVEDLLRHPELTHVVLVAGDSDFVPLAQSCKQLGRYVVGIGVSGSTSRALVSACNEFIEYSDLPGLTPSVAPSSKTSPTKSAAAKKTSKKPAKKSADGEATDLLIRAIRIALQKSDGEWVYASGVKSQMQRMDPAFTEKSLGFSSFRAFVESRDGKVLAKVADNGQLTVKLP